MELIIEYLNGEIRATKTKDVKVTEKELIFIVTHGVNYQNNVVNMNKVYNIYLNGRDINNFKAIDS